MIEHACNSEQDRDDQQKTNDPGGDDQAHDLIPRHPNREARRPDATVERASSSLIHM
jgi:hypothetical protein